jgi:octaprenyl-diphosphate synthase
MLPDHRPGRVVADEVLVRLRDLCIDGGLSGLASTMEDLVGFVRDDLAAVENELAALSTRGTLVGGAGADLVHLGGKRLRPLCVVLASRVGVASRSAVRDIAVAAELIHNATLLHDDVVDESDLRRGLATANTVWGNQASVLVGDFLFSRAFQLMVADGNLEVLAVLSRASAVIAEGEVLQLITSNDTSTSEATYLEVIGAKTAALFAAACRVGALVAERPAAETDAVESYGRNLGIAFQLVDDALDYSAGQGALGKSIGDDFKEGKITLPVLLAFARGDDAERAFWRRCLERLEQRDGDLDRAIGLMQNHNALADTIDRAWHYGAEARAALASFPDGTYRAALTDLVEFCVERVY